MFDKLELHGNKVNGELTLGENIADLGGVEIAFNSLVDYYYNHKDELTNDSYKRFFYSYANIWKCVITKEEVIKRLTTDPHSPPRFRVNAILNNVNAFYNTFDIPKNSPMWLEENERFSIW
jgi:putative endopeptidase